MKINRIKGVADPAGKKISLPTDIMPILEKWRAAPQEHFFCVSLNGAHEVIAARIVTIGLVDKTHVQKFEQTYEEYTMNEDIPLEPPPPGKDRLLGKQCIRWIAERVTGIVEHDDKKGHVIKGPHGRRVPIDEIPSILASHEGYHVELKIYKDHDPDGQFRIAEALEGWKGTFTSDYRESMYAERIRQELERALPDVKYAVKLHSETIHVTPQVGEKPKARYSLSSPRLGQWILKYREGTAWEQIGIDSSFIECLRILITMEKREHKRL